MDAAFIDMEAVLHALWMECVRTMTSLGMQLVVVRLQAQLVYDTADMVLDRLEEVQSSISRIVWQERRNVDRSQVMARAEEAVRTMLQHSTEHLGTA